MYVCYELLIAVSPMVHGGAAQTSESEFNLLVNLQQL